MLNPIDIFNLMFENEDQLKIENLPIFKKGEEILELVFNICDLIPEEDEHLQMIKGLILEDAMQLTGKVVAAEGGDLYDLRMESAAIIRKAACDLMVQNHSLEMFGFEYVEYYTMIRNLIEEYRILFIEWVAGFDKSNYIVDRWGLFNPPGVGPFDSECDF